MKMLGKHEEKFSSLVEDAYFQNMFSVYIFSNCQQEIDFGWAYKVGLSSMIKLIAI